MTAQPDFHLHDIPPGARPWSQGRDLSPNVWYLFLPGEVFRCPACRNIRGETSEGKGIAVRVHPDGRGAPPSSVRGHSFTCRCGVHLDVRDLPKR